MQRDGYSHTVGGKYKWTQPSFRTTWSYVLILKINISFDSQVPLFTNYPTEMHRYTNIYTMIFTEALSIRATKKRNIQNIHL